MLAGRGSKGGGERDRETEGRERERDGERERERERARERERQTEIEREGEGEGKRERGIERERDSVCHASYLHHSHITVSARASARPSSAVMKTYHCQSCHLFSESTCKDADAPWTGETADAVLEIMAEHLERVHELDDFAMRAEFISQCDIVEQEAWRADDGNTAGGGTWQRPADRSSREIKELVRQARVAPSSSSTVRPRPPSTPPPPPAKRGRRSPACKVDILTKAPGPLNALTRLKHLKGSSDSGQQGTVVIRYGQVKEAIDCVQRAADCCTGARAILLKASGGFQQEAKSLNECAGDLAVALGQSRPAETAVDQNDL